MTEHEPVSYPPPQQIPLVLVRAKAVYRTWHNSLTNFKRVDRYTIGVKIDELFLALLENIFLACFAYDKFEKFALVSQAIGKADLTKFFLQLSWEQKVINHKIYGQLILELEEVGRMLGGWKKSLNNKTPARR